MNGTRAASLGGGIGGLLAVTDHISAKTYLPFYDGNGNVVGMTDAAAGVSVRYFVRRLAAGVQKEAIHHSGAVLASFGNFFLVNERRIRRVRVCSTATTVPSGIRPGSRDDSVSCVDPRNWARRRVVEFFIISLTND